MAAATPSLSAALVDALKRLRLGRIAATLPERLVLADKQDMAFDELLLMILTDEIGRRDNAAADNRANEAGLDPSMRLELWDVAGRPDPEESDATSGRRVSAVPRSISVSLPSSACDSSRA